MPLFFYIPLIVWLGMCAAVQSEMRPVAAKAKARRRMATHR